MKEQLQIKEMDSWNRFLASGRVEDYLQYVSQSVEMAHKDAEKSNWVGDSSHAGFYTGDRYHIEADAYR